MKSKFSIGALAIASTIGLLFAHARATATDFNPDRPDLMANACPQGTQYWRRDRVTEICVPVCATDADCGRDFGRCRIIDPANRSAAPDMPFIDEVPADELDARLAGVDPANPPVTICDPFYEIQGAVDADLAMDRVE